MGYLRYGPDAVTVLFQVVNNRNVQRCQMIFAVNKSLSARGRALHDLGLAEVILDRLLERGRHIELRRRSLPTRHASRELNPDLEPLSPAPPRISGNHRPEFPGPTRVGPATPGQAPRIPYSVCAPYPHCAGPIGRATAGHLPP